ncbi:hypothetical protein KP509_22G024000 [Ceratopteris richardii]|nr:hypothetical protein KP509_22G024000 [Ceratopteris richardii]
MATLVDGSSRIAAQEALVFVNDMEQSEHEIALAKSCVSSLKTYTRQKDLLNGTRLHAEILQMGFLQRNQFVASALINMYSKCGALSKAQELFNQVAVRTTVLWNTLISAYTHYGLEKEAFCCYEQMLSEGISPNAVTFTCILKACSSTRALHKGQQVHSQIKTCLSLEDDAIIVSALVDMYAKCGALKTAQEVFDEYQNHDQVSWNALIAGYTQWGYGHEAIRCFEKMQSAGFSPDSVTFTCVLQACGCVGALDKGQDVHAQIRRAKFLEKCNMVVAALIDMYVQCGVLEMAKEVFDELLNPSILAWNVLIAGYAKYGYGKEALQLYERMSLDDHVPDATVFPSILKACGLIGDFERGEKVHAQILARDLLGTDIVVGNSLIDMYIKCGLLGRAQNVFNDFVFRNVVSWTTLIAGYVHHGYSEKALDCYAQMLLEGFSPDIFTLTCVLKACGNMGNLNMGQQIHAQIEQDCCLREQTMLANAVVSMYAKCGAFENARAVFDEVKNLNNVSWTSLIAGYTQHGNFEAAIEIFEQMWAENHCPDALTFAWILKSFGSIGAAYRGQQLHSYIVKCGLLKDDVIQGTMFMAMYAQCGMLVEAHELFDKLSNPDVVSYSALMIGYGQLGKDEVVFDLFDKMVKNSLTPNAGVFVAILSTCAHLGLLDKGKFFFQLLHEAKNVLSVMEHYVCMVGLLARAGLIEEAVATIELIQFPPNPWLWHTLVGACQNNGSFDFGLWAFCNAVDCNEADTEDYVSLSIINGVSAREYGESVATSEHLGHIPLLSEILRQL